MHSLVEHYETNHKSILSRPALEDLVSLELAAKTAEEVQLEYEVEAELSEEENRCEDSPYLIFVLKKVKFSSNL